MTEPEAIELREAAYIDLLVAQSKLREALAQLTEAGGTKVDDYHARRVWVLKRAATTASWSIERLRHKS